jgi:hypothetical protein
LPQHPTRAGDCEGSRYKTMGSVSGLDADVKGAWSKRRYEAYQ